MYYSFKFKPFKSKVKKFAEAEMGVVIKKKRRAVSVYGTDNTHKNIFCMIPLCPPRYLRGAKYEIEFYECGKAKITVLDMQIVINFSEQKCSNNRNTLCYGSDAWGEDVQVKWSKKAI